MFHVINIKTNEVELDPHGNPVVYPTGQAAAQVAQHLTMTRGTKYQPRAIVSIDWQAREQHRLDNRTYIRLFWDQTERARYRYPNDVEYQTLYCKQHWFHQSELTRQHYAHVSKIPGNIAFTESAEKGQMDIQTSMKPGRYLTRFYKDLLCGAYIKTFSAEFHSQHNPGEVFFATTADEIEHVYTTGPSSCMSAAANKYQSNCHPTRVYAAGDLAVAYLASEQGTDDEHISARALCWPDKKQYGRIYDGGDGRIARMLESEGYSSGDLQGARLCRIAQDGRYLVVPYIDNVGRVSPHPTDKKYLIIDRHGSISGESTNGIVTIDDDDDDGTVECDRCGRRWHEDETHHIENEDQYWCDHCTQRIAFHCDHSDAYRTDGPVIMANGETWSDAAFDAHGFMCDATQENHPVENIVTMANDVLWSQTYFTTHGWYCNTCNTNFPNDDRCSACDVGNIRPPIVGRDESPDQIPLAI